MNIIKENNSTFVGHGKIPVVEDLPRGRKAFYATRAENESYSTSKLGETLE